MSKTLPNTEKLTVEEIETFEPSTERERFSFDLGYEAGWEARLNLDLALDLDDIREVMRVLVEALDRRIAEAKQPKPSRGRIEFEDAVIELPDEEQGR